MKILVAFPDVPYYNWQVLVQINNLVKFGYSNQIIYVVGKQPNVGLSKQIKTILDNTPVEYYVYDDERRRNRYASSLRPHILKKLFYENSGLNNESFFYVDPDLYFAKTIDFTSLLSGNTWHVSDTRSYIDSGYIKSKSEQLFNEMCEIVDVSPTIITNNDLNAGGAQYLMKNIDCRYWLKVEHDSERLYRWLKHTENKYSPSHPIQSWTSDMWAVLWNGWFHNHNIKINSSLSFSWATEPISSYDNNNLFHNAGVASQTNLFNKISYQTNPFNKDFSHVSPEFCSYKMVEEIEETKLNYPDLIQLF